jgi:hypothetical protein
LRPSASTGARSRYFSSTETLPITTEFPYEVFDGFIHAESPGGFTIAASKGNTGKAMTRNARGHRFDREKFAGATCETFLTCNDEQVSSDISNHEKVALLRRHFFADIDALEKTGGIAFAVSADNRDNSVLARDNPYLKGRH